MGEALHYWIQRLNAVTPAQVDAIFAKVPDSIITPEEAKFARSLLAKTQEIINCMVKP